MNELARNLPKAEAKEGPSYYAGSALIQLEGERYRWGRKSEVEGKAGWQSAAKLKARAWKAAQGGGLQRPVGKQ
jgi:hypothetical protein